MAGNFGSKYHAVLLTDYPRTYLGQATDGLRTSGCGARPTMDGRRTPDTHADNVNCSQLTSGGAAREALCERGQECGVARKAVQRRKGGRCMVGDAALGLFRREANITI